MKIFTSFYEALCCKKNLKLKKKMGFSITLRDIENTPMVKRKVRKNAN